MSDKLKKYVADNEAKFDSAPLSGHFDRFKLLQEKQAKKQSIKSKNIGMSVVIKIAAIFVLVIGVSWLFFNLGKLQHSQPIVDLEITPAQFSNELLEAEVFFTEQVSLKKKEVLSLASTNDAATQQIMRELQKLELQYLDLKDELLVNRSNEQIINAMIENYRLRLSVMERLLQQLKKSNKVKQKHHENIQA